MQESNSPRAIGRYTLNNLFQDGKLWCCVLKQKSCVIKYRLFSKPGGYQPFWRGASSSIPGNMRGYFLLRSWIIVIVVTNKYWYTNEPRQLLSLIYHGRKKYWKSTCISYFWLSQFVLKCKYMNTDYLVIWCIFFKGCYWVMLFVLTTVFRTESYRVPVGTWIHSVAF